MRRFIIAVAVAVALNLSCGSKVSTQNHEDSSPGPSPVALAPKGAGSKQEQENHFRAALKLHLAGETAQAIEEFKKAIEAGDDNKETYREVAMLLIDLKRYEEAEIYLRKVIEKDAKDARAHWELAALLTLQFERYEEGLREANLAEEYYGKDGLSYVRDHLIGKAYDGLGDYGNALKHYKRFLKGRSYAPDSEDYKEAQKRVSELEKRR